MKKVLIISYYWPPAGGPGSQRVVKFAKYLPQCGWQPIVLTVENGEFPYNDPSLENDIPADVKVYRTKSWEPFLFYKKLTGRKEKESLPVGLLTHKNKSMAERFATWIRANLFVPDARIGWKPFALKAALKIMKDENIDLIFSSSPPHSLQLIAKSLKHKTGLPWVADFRDRWTGIRYYQVLKRNAITKRIDAYFEKKILTAADSVTATSEGFIEDFKEMIKPKPQQFHFLPNGYDEDDFANLPSQTASHFKIVHAGNLIAQQNPEVLWKILIRLIEDNDEFRESLKIRLVGKVHEFIIQEINQAKLSDFVEIENYMPHKEVLNELQSASVLLAVIPKLPQNKSIVLGKIYEYIGTGKPMLIIGPPEGNAAQIISQFDNSMICEYGDEKKCREFMERTFSHWINNNQVPEAPVEQRAPYSRRRLTESLSDIFDSLA